MDRRVLLLTPPGRDDDLVGAVFDRAGVAMVRCAHARHLVAEMTRGADGAIVAAASLEPTDLPGLRRWLDAQPDWSDFPFIVLADPRAGGWEAQEELAATLGNAVVLDRPSTAATLASAVQVALRGRARQYAARRHAIERDNDERRLRIALLAGDLAVWTVDLRDRSLQASDPLKAHFGRAVERPMAFRDLVAAIHPDDRTRVLAALDAAFAQQATLSIDCRILWPKGGVRWLRLSGQAIASEDGPPSLFSGVSLDVTGQHAAKEELEHRLAEAVARDHGAQRALIQAQKMEAIAQLTGGIAHDFNNLLTAIVGNIDLIGRRTSDDRIRAMVARARHATDRAARLTGQLLAFSRSQRLDLRPVAVDPLLAGMRDLIARTIGPSIAVKAELAVPDRMASADANQLELAVLNLAINARDAMPAGGTLTIATRLEQGGAASGAAEWIVIAVSDTGTGIAPDILPRVFDPFFTTKPFGKGTGLGLSQVYGIAQQSGGSTALRSVVGEGTTVEIRLRPATGEAAPGAEGGEEDGLYVGCGRVLVVDDDVDVRRFIVECLEMLGFTVTQAADGSSGLDRLAGDAPDLLIVDFAMPGMNGAEVAAAAHARFANLPIILTTGYADTAQVEAAFAKDAILRKPFRLLDLSRAVRHALETRRPGG